MRAIGVVLILFACLLIERTYRKRIFYKERVLFELCEFFGAVVNGLSQSVRPISELASGVELPELLASGFLGDVLDGKVIADAYENAREALSVSEKIDTYLRGFFKYGIHGTRKEALEAASLVLRELKDEHASMRGQCEVKARLMRVILISLGIGIGIAVI